MTKAERRYMGRVAALSCAICDCEGVHVHHIRTGQGMGERASNYLTIPLCPTCHQGPSGIHGDKQLLRAIKMDELDLLAETIRRLNE